MRIINNGILNAIVNPICSLVTIVIPKQASINYNKKN